MNQVFNELLEIKKLVNLLFDKEAEIDGLDYWPDNSNEWAKKVTELQTEIKEIKNELKKLL